MEKQYVVLIEPIMNGRYYLPDILRRGYYPIVVFFKDENIVRPNWSKVLDYVKEYAESIIMLRNEYFFDASEDSNNNSPEEICSEELLRLLAHLKVIAVIPGSDLGTALATVLAEKLNLPANSFFSEERRCNQCAIHNVLSRTGLNFLRTQIVHTVDEGIAFALKIGAWPLVLKWRDFNDRGVVFCLNINELKEKLEDLFIYRIPVSPKRWIVILQEFVVGSDYLVNTVSCNGQHYLTDLWEYHKTVKDYLGGVLYDYVRLVSRLEAEQEETVEYVKNVLTALEYRFGPVQADVVYSEHGPVLIGCEPRPLRGAFPVMLIEECLGHSIVDRALDAWIDPRRFQKFASEKYRPKKTLMCKLFITKDEKEITSIPLIALLRFVPTARKGNFLESIEKFKLNKTKNLIVVPDNVLLCDENEDLVMEDYANIRAIEIEVPQMLFSNRIEPLDCPDRILTPEEERAFFQPVSAQCNCWRIGAAKDPKAFCPGWNYAGAGQWPTGTVWKAVITGLAKIPDWEVFINRIGTFCDSFPVYGKLTIFVAPESPVSRRAWILLLQALGWGTNDWRLGSDRLEFIKLRTCKKNNRFFS